MNFVYFLFMDYFLRRDCASFAGCPFGMQQIWQGETVSCMAGPAVLHKGKNKKILSISDPFLGRNRKFYRLRVTIYLR